MSYIFDEWDVNPFLMAFGLIIMSVVEVHLIGIGYLYIALMFIIGFLLFGWSISFAKKKVKT